jgi:hypothetical protein
MMKIKSGPYFPSLELLSVKGTSRFVIIVRAAGTAIAIKRYIL